MSKTHFSHKFVLHPHIARHLGTAHSTDDAGAALLEFDFAPGKSCSLHASCNSKGKFQLFFNVPASEERPNLEKLLNLKLKNARAWS
jgi:hypothetical protein